MMERIERCSSGEPDLVNTIDNLTAAEFHGSLGPVCHAVLHPIHLAAPPGKRALYHFLLRDNPKSPFLDVALEHGPHLRSHRTPGFSAADEAEAVSTFSVVAATTGDGEM